jgi:hypothetical protein
MKGTTMRARLSVISLSLCLLLAAVPALVAQGHFEFGGHYGRWSLNLIGNLAKDALNDAVKDEIEDRILTDIQDSYPGLAMTSYEQGLDFSSSGDDFGFGFRFYPGGHRGSFSLGVSVERSTFKVLPAVTSLMELQDTSTMETATFNGTASASALIKATSFLLTVRWDILPRAAVHPYITFGGGISTARALDDSTLSYSYTGQLTGSAIPAETVEGSDTKTLRELKDEAESDFPLPNFLPFIQLNVGLKARLTKNIHVLIDGGVFDGFMISGGVSVRL